MLVPSAMALVEVPEAKGPRTELVAADPKQTQIVQSVSADLSLDLVLDPVRGG